LPRWQAVGYIRGLLGDVEGKNGRQLAEHMGDPTPDGGGTCSPRLIGDTDAVRDD
jgi:hypothetical protein